MVSKFFYNELWFPYNSPIFDLFTPTNVTFSVTSAILSGGLYGIIGKFGPAYITAVVGGQALGGIFAAIVQIISLAIGASSLHSALVYFTIGNITIVICIVSYIILCKSVFFKFHLREKVPISDEFQNILIRPEIISYRTILSKIRAYGISLFLVFGITMVVYPGVTVLIESEGRGKGHAWNGDIKKLRVCCIFTTDCSF